MSWTIRKPGQGYWTRLLSGLGAGVLLLFGAKWLWETLKAYIDSLYVVAAISLAPLLLLGYLTFRWTAVKEKPVDFLIETDDEMKQVNWPSRREVIGSTIVVIVCIFLLVGLLFDADQMFADLFAAANVLHFGGESVILSMLGWTTPTVWVLAAVGLSALAFAIVRFFAIKKVVIHRLGLENPAPTGVMINTVLQTAVVIWLAFHGGALMGFILSIEQVQQWDQADKVVPIAIWALAGVIAVIVGVAIDNLTLRHHDDGESDRARTISRGSTGGNQGAAWAMLQVIGTQVAQ